MAPATASMFGPTDHSELVEEMQLIEKMPVGERIKLAQKRRKQQLSTYAKWIKTDSTSKTGKKNHKSVVFSPVAQLMEAATHGSYEEMRALLKSGGVNISFYLSVGVSILQSETILHSEHFLSRCLCIYLLCT